MNLLMISGDTSAAQGERGAFYNTLSEFARYWDRVDVITPPIKDLSGFQSLIGLANVFFHPSSLSKALHPKFILRRGQELAHERRYDLIISHDYGFFLNGIGAAWLSKKIGVPYISEIHHVEGHPRAATLRERLQPTLTWLYVQWAKHRALGFRIVNERELKPLLKRWGIPDHQLHLLYSLYLDFDVFKPAADLRNFQDSGSLYDAIFVGRLTPNKLPFLFISTLVAANPALGRKTRALIVGQGSMAKEVKKFVRDLHLDVEFIDWVESPHDLANLYRQAKCLICTSYSEGGPRVVAEALACGVPVITTRVGLAAELVRDGENGFLCDWNAAELGQRLVQIISGDSLRIRLSENAPRAVQRFEKKRVIKEYAERYQRLLRDA
jgi:glycosyltransferase involved in cell wall biosynthesis